MRSDGAGEDDLLPLYDPQTSGGLLVAVPEARFFALVGALEKCGVTGAVVGEVAESTGVRVAVRAKTTVTPVYRCKMSVPCTRYSTPRCLSSP